MYNSNIQSEEKTILEAHQRFLDLQHAHYLNGVNDGKKESAETIEALTTEVNTLNTEVNTLNTEVNTLNAEVNTLNAEVNTLNAENERLKKLLSQAGISAE